MNSVMKQLMTITTAFAAYGAIVASAETGASEESTAEQASTEGEVVQLAQGTPSSKAGGATAPSVNFFNQGIEAMKAQEFIQAVVNFERVLGLDPDHHRARAELARAYYQMGNFTRSRTEFDRVLDANPPDTVKQNINAFLDEMDRGGPKRWNASWGLGIIYDDNVNFGPASKSVSIQPIVFGPARITKLNVNKNSRPNDTFGYYGQASAGIHHDIGSEGAWDVFGQASYYQTWLDDADDFEILYGSGMGGLRYEAEKHLVEVPVKFEHLTRGDDALANIYGVLPGMVYALSEDWHLITSGLVEYRDYDEFDDLDSYYLKLGENARHFYPNGNVLSVGLAAFTEQADDDIYTNIGFETFAELTLAHLPWNTSARLRGHYRGEWYDEREELAPEDRVDHEVQLEVALDKPVNEQVKVSSSYQFTHNESTFDLHQYDRNLITVGVTGKL